MRRIDPDVWAGGLVVLLCLATGVPILLAQLDGRSLTTGPPWLWWLASGGFMVALVVVAIRSEERDRRPAATSYAVQVVLGAAVVLLAPGAGWTPILLVFTAAIGPYVVSPRSTALVVAANTLTVGLSVTFVDGLPVEVVVTAGMYLLLQGVSVLTVLGQLHDQSSRRQLALAHTELRAATALLAESSRNAERLRIARDLHDVIGHQVTALALELEVATHKAAGPAVEHVTRARGIAKALLTDLRTTVADLRDATPAIGEALRAVVADLPHPVVHLHVDDRLQVDEAVRTALVRCVQEVVTNAIRHSGADNLWIDVTGDGHGGLTLTARDDGRGAADLQLGHGLMGMSERLEALGGHACFSPSGGFGLTATVPAP